MAFPFCILRPLIARDDVELFIHSGMQRELLASSRRTHSMPCSPTLRCVVMPKQAGTATCSTSSPWDQTGVRPNLAAEVDVMAMLRLMARETNGVTLVPPVIVKDELESGALVERRKLPQIKEAFLRHHAKPEDFPIRSCGN